MFRLWKESISILRSTVKERQDIERLVLVPLLAMGSYYKAWVHVQSLPNDDVIILVADFDGPDTQNNRVTETILEQLWFFRILWNRPASHCL